MLDGHPRPGRGAVREIAFHQRTTDLVYAPNLDGDADPGEVVWAWVPYEDDPSRGKDRPLLVVGRDGRALHAMMLSSRAPEDHEEQDWLALGSGAWDREERASYLRLDRLFELDEDDIRREGAVLDATRFQAVAVELHRRYGWR
ncbi:type II toxin-antitoxin system PemK/MazF family toxin [Goodfellowiella coeruleoviolacea]|uniref:type II toxin-antitoxin system PemK/MazF family toxin n=1 Tax=Goodfellowiella coeruleoviolacea TaxID=334858 RepID=UPI0020A5F3BE|nr:type II toxin-antitoxin system PemK/MazF family toxin [Goodfellowiella coeruleoviolacea]